jgi:hypothetical protein
MAVWIEKSRATLLGRENFSQPSAACLVKLPKKGETDYVSPANARAAESMDPAVNDGVAQAGLSRPRR